MSDQPTHDVIVDVPESASWVEDQFPDESGVPPRRLPRRPRSEGAGAARQSARRVGRVSRYSINRAEVLREIDEGGHRWVRRVP